MPISISGSSVSVQLPLLEEAHFVLSVVKYYSTKASELIIHKLSFIDLTFIPNYFLIAIKFTWLNVYQSSKATGKVFAIGLPAIDAPTIF